MKIYLAGPMRGYPEFNHPAFHAATARLRAAGHEVFSPAEDCDKRGIRVKGLAGNHDDITSQGFPLPELLLGDLAWICTEANALVYLPGSEDSLGAQAEMATARAIGIGIHPLEGFLDEDRDI